MRIHLNLSFPFFMNQTASIKLPVPTGLKLLRLLQICQQADPGNDRCQHLIDSILHDRVTAAEVGQMLTLIKASKEILEGQINEQGEHIKRCKKEFDECHGRFNHALTQAQAALDKEYKQALK